MAQERQEQVVQTLPEVDGISDDAVAKAKAMIGTRLRTEQFVRDASLGALLNFVNGIGDTNTRMPPRALGAPRVTRLGSVIIAIGDQAGKIGGASSCRGISRRLRLLPSVNQGKCGSREGSITVAMPGAVTSPR